ncbi:MAG TPA: YCF48-related protein, partial [Bacteroidia bacterium]|nr:YCF48-related protein [Bacteroidia bacterium]
MKVKNYTLFTLFFLVGVLSAYAQCNSVDAGDDKVIVCGDTIRLQGQPRWSDGLDSTASNFRGVFFTDSITGYTVGDNGIIHKTINGGTSWTNQTSGVTSNLQAVFFTNATTGYVVGENGLILKTINGGSSWTAQTSGTSNTLYSVYFTDANTGIAVGTNGAILKTINAGASWTLKFSNVVNNLISVHFSGTSVGYVASDGYILKTQDGGETWKTIQNAPNNIFIKIFFTSTTTGYVTLRDINGANTILKTTNGGTNWSTLNVSSSYAFSSMFFTSATTGYVGSVGRIYKTNDAGATWESQPINLLNVEDIHFPNPRTGYAVGNTTMTKKTIKYVTPDLVTWLPATGLSSTTIMNPLANPTTTTTYTITTKKGTCIQKDTVRVTVTPLTVDAGADKKMICGSSVQLNAITTNSLGKLTYSWSPTTGLSDPTIATPTITVKQTTTFRLTVKTANGCTASDSVKVVVDPLVANAGSDKTLVCGGSVQLAYVGSNYTGSGTLTYSWSPTTGLNSSI